jgi:hypothetical protein
MIYLSVLYSGLGISLFYLLLRNWFKKEESIFVTLILFSNPLVWYYGCLEEIYSFEIFFSVLLIYLSTKNRLIYFSPLLMGIGSGIRPSSAVLLFPLYIYLWFLFYKSYRPDLKYIFLSHVLGILSLFAWFLPLTNSVGGIWAYFKMFQTHSPIQQITFWQNLVQFLIYLTYPLFGLFVGVIIVFVQNYFFQVKFKSVVESFRQFNQLTKIIVFWIFSPVLFFTFIHYSKGTLLLCIAGIITIYPLMFRQNRFEFKLYSLIIIFQIVFFVFVTYELPNVQSYFNRSERDISLFQILKERLGSNYQFSNSNIKNMQCEYQVVEKIIEKYKYDTSIPFTAKKYIFIDPTMVISPRSLQYEYPNIFFAKISPRMKSTYEVLKGLDLRRGKPLPDVLSNSIIVSRKDFVDIYLNKIKKTQENYNAWSIFVVEKNDINNLSKIYTKYFMR